MKSLDSYKCRERIQFVDLAKFVGIFLMVLCHSGMQNLLTVIIYAFHMPLFFFLSGYLFDRNKNHDGLTIRFIKKRVYAILVPYTFFSLILCFGKSGMIDWAYILYASRDSLAFADSFTPLWFLPCFFLSSVIFFVVSKLTMSNGFLYYMLISLITIVGFVLSSFRVYLPYGYPFNFDVAFIGVLLMALGNEVKKIPLNPYLGGAFFLAGMILSLFNRPISLTYDNPHVEMSISSYGNPFLFIIVSCMLCMAIVYWCRKIIECQYLPQKIINLMSFFGENTIIVLCIHGIFVNILMISFSKLGIELLGIEAIAISILCFGLLYPTIYFMNKYIPNLIGKRVCK